uniref:Transmembrane 4 L six family member 4 n=1 Tax=Malurus cyaneus samueli TaxID=2593467 RepID=A0A8C5T345_9PASS
MCTGGCAKCLGGTLIPLAVLCTLANILLFFPGGKVVKENEHITTEVWYFGGILGSGVLMIFPALVFLGLQNNDCCGCCGNRGCGQRFAVIVGAGYCFILSAVALNKGPKCFTIGGWTYPFRDGDYLRDHRLWHLCLSPANIVPWHLTLFSLLLVMSLIQGILCAIQVVNGLFGTLCDCREPS